MRRRSAGSSLRVDQPVLLELARERRGRGEGQAELARQLADRALALAADLGEERDVAAAERRALDELEQLRRRPAARPEAAHHPPQLEPQLRHPVRVRYHQITIIVDELKGGEHTCVEDIIIARRGFRGYPNREQWVDRLQAYREHLEEELKNVQELIERLGEQQAPAETV